MQHQGLPYSRIKVLFRLLLCMAGRYDADQSYDLPEEGYVTLDPVQPPTAPAYKTALAQKRASHNIHAPG